MVEMELDESQSINLKPWKGRTDTPQWRKHACGLSRLQRSGTGSKFNQRALGKNDVDILLPLQDGKLERRYYYPKCNANGDASI